jgi:hypothetical protein
MAAQARAGAVCSPRCVSTGVHERVRGRCTIQRASWCARVLYGRTGSKWGAHNGRGSAGLGCTTDCLCGHLGAYALQGVVRPVG